MEHKKHYLHSDKQKLNYSVTYNLKKILKEKKLTRNQVSTDTGLARSFITKLYNNEDAPKFNDFLRLAQYLNVSPYELMTITSTADVSFNYHQGLTAVNDTHTKAIIRTIVTLTFSNSVPVTGLLDIIAKKTSKNVLLEFHLSNINKSSEATAILFNLASNYPNFNQKQFKKILFAQSDASQIAMLDQAMSQRILTPLLTNLISFDNTKIDCRVDSWLSLGRGEYTIKPKFNDQTTFIGLDITRNSYDKISNISFSDF